MKEKRIRKRNLKGKDSLCETQKKNNTQQDQQISQKYLLSNDGDDQSYQLQRSLNLPRLPKQKNYRKYDQKGIRRVKMVACECLKQMKLKHLYNFWAKKKQGQRNKRYIIILVIMIVAKQSIDLAAIFLEKYKKICHQILKGKHQKFKNDNNSSQFETLEPLKNSLNLTLISKLDQKLCKIQNSMIITWKLKKNQNNIKIQYKKIDIKKINIQNDYFYLIIKYKLSFLIHHFNNLLYLNSQIYIIRVRQFQKIKNFIFHPSFYKNESKLDSQLFDYCIHNSFIKSRLPKITMSQDNEKDKSNNEEKKKTRRTRKDQEGRNFTCPCGKSYLSYPALYTHVKTKHQGKAPKQDAGATSKVEVEQENQTKDPLVQVKQIIDKYFPGDDITAYPTPLSRQDSQYIKSILETWTSVKESRLDESSNNSTQAINNIFARFLSEIKPQIKAEGYLYLCQFICCFHHSIIQAKNDKDYCRDNNGTQLPNFFNEFIIKKKAPAYEIKRGSPNANLLLACKVLFSFGAWIFQQRYTNFSVKYNSLPV